MNLQRNFRPFADEITVGLKFEHLCRVVFDVGETSLLELRGLENVRLAEDAADLLGAELVAKLRFAPPLEPLYLSIVIRNEPSLCEQPLTYPKTSSICLNM